VRFCKQALAHLLVTLIPRCFAYNFHPLVLQIPFNSSSVAWLRNGLSSGGVTIRDRASGSDVGGILEMCLSQYLWLVQISGSANGPQNTRRPGQD
jgi:hypothetical protein